MSPLANATRGVSVLLILMLVSGLAACSPVSVATDSYPGYPEGVDEPFLETPLAFWKGPDALLLTLGGSSSCPAVPTSVKQTDGEVVIAVDRGLTFLCTADDAITTYVISADEPPTNVTLVSEGHQQSVEIRDL